MRFLEKEDPGKTCQPNGKSEGLAIIICITKGSAQFFKTQGILYVGLQADIQLGISMEENK